MISPQQAAADRLLTDDNNKSADYGITSLSLRPVVLPFLMLFLGSTRWSSSVSKGQRHQAPVPAAAPAAGMKKLKPYQNDDEHDQGGPGVSLDLSFNQLVLIRKKMQKLEFMASWIIIAYLLFVSRCKEQEALLLPPQVASIAPVFLSIYFKVTVFTRAMAYAVDLINANRVYKAVPLWLVLHHAGVFGTHFIYFFLHSRPEEECCPYTVFFMIMAIATQSTHNTWTKKVSIVGYWANVGVGVFTLVYYNRVYLENDTDAVKAYCYYSQLMTVGGVLLLVLGSRFPEISIGFRVTRLEDKRKDTTSR